MNSCRVAHGQQLIRVIGEITKSLIEVIHIVNVLFSATPHLPAVFQPVMLITQKKKIPSLTYILI